MCPNSAEFPNKSTQIGEFSTQLCPKQLHNFKKTFRHYHETSPKISMYKLCANCSTFQNDFTILVPNSMCDLGTFVCIESRRLSPQFPRLTQNICASRPHTVPTFPRDFPQKICTLLHANSMCDSPRLCEELRHAFIHRVTCGTESALRCSTCLL